MSGALGKVSWSFTLSGAVVLGILLAVAAALGTNGVISAHPKAEGGRLSHTVLHWATPAVLAASAVAHISVLRAPEALAVSVVGFGILAAVLLSLEFVTVDGAWRGYGRARWALSLLDYLVALAAFVAAIGAGISTGLCAALCGVAAALVAVDLLRLPDCTPDVVGLYVPAVGVIIGLAAQRILTWNTQPIRAALILLLLFYVLTGLLQQHLRRRVSWWVRVEYFALLALGTWALLRFGV
jgi:hypothetical protein